MPEARTAQTDLLVIGGGITGCGLAREAALRGLRVILLEKRDLAWGTSSRSTKLLHGGLRYLEQGHLGLVREALREREALARMAPHLARPISFVVPTRRGGHPGPLTARIGLKLYDLLAGHSALPGGRTLPADEIMALLPQIARGDNGHSLIGALFFSDRRTDDARLTIAVARDAAALGAAVRLRCEVTDLLERRGAVTGVRYLDHESGEAGSIEAALVINATGPWADRLRSMAGAPDRAVRPSRGTHLVLPDLGLSSAVMMEGSRRGQRLFALPWRGVTLLGTTDDDDAGDPDTVAPREEDVRQLLDQARRQMPSANLTPRSIISSFAGLRPLVADRGDTVDVTREHRLLNTRGMLTLVGGKLTTWRSTAERTIDYACARLGRGARGRGASAQRPLPGGAPRLSADDPRLASLPAALREHLLGQYGSEAIEVAGLARADEEAARPIADGAADIMAQVDFAVRHEMALCLEDVLKRRLSCGHLPAQMTAAAPAVAARMRRLRGWSAQREHQEISALQTGLSVPGAETIPAFHRG